MPIIEWNIGFLLGIKEIDECHQQLVKLLNDTYDDFRLGGEIKHGVLDKLIDYGNTIFQLEEKLMREVGYPKLEEHKGEHESYTSRIQGFKLSAQEHKKISIELLWFLCNWVTHHLRETDTEFGHFVDVHKINRRVKGKGKATLPKP